MIKTLFALVVSVQILSAQTYYTGYKWVQIGGVNFVRETKKIKPMGRDSVATQYFKAYSDTASLRVDVTQTMMQKRNQSYELQAEADRLGIEADSLYEVLVDLNDGYGSVDDVPPLRIPTNPAEEYKQIMWGAILREDEVNGVG